MTLPSPSQQMRPQNLNLIIIKNITEYAQTHMSYYDDAFFENKSPQNDQNYIENIQELFLDLQRRLDFDYQENKDVAFRNTNYNEKHLIQELRPQRSINSIVVSKEALNNYIQTKRGSSNQTMELLHNFKTFIVHKIKDLLLIKFLNKQEINNCLHFMRSKPSFEALGSLLNPQQKCQQLQNHLVELFSSSQIIRQVMSSGIRLPQKQKLLKFIERMREKLKNPRNNHKWKQFSYLE